MRLFAAVEIPEGIREKLHSICAGMQGRGMRAVARENMHVTLKFLGEVGEGEELEWVLGRLGKVEFSPFKASVSGLGAFPNAKSARVLWAGVESGGKLEELALKVEDALSGRFAREGRGFSAHLTLARMKGRVDLRKVVEAHSGEGFGEFEVRRFLLMKSVLGGRGAKYMVVREFGAGREE